MLKKRYLTPFIVEDLKQKMVFVSGPRQVGKTTLSKELITDFYPHFGYYNWDFKEDRKLVLAARWPTEAHLIILDEIHKYRKWKTLIKGYWDKFKEKYTFLVTGSARLNIFRRGGDSLQGRYHNYRLHPFTVAEYGNGKNSIVPLEELPIKSINHQKELEILFHFGGFPEPLLKQNDRHLRRWHREKTERLFREDILELEMIRDMGNLQLLCDMLPQKVSSLLSLNTIREDLEVSHKAVSHWMKVLETFYYCYRIYPFTSKTIRSLKKEPKLYLWDWSEIKNEGARYENLIASHLLKLVHFIQDYEGYNCQLHYLRDRDKREVDFLVTLDNKPWFACEAKLQDEDPSPSLSYFKDRLNIPFTYQITYQGTKDYVTNGIRVLPAAKFLGSLL
jgi:predicted AAA+ superfamily ATPase